MLVTCFAFCLEMWDVIERCDFRFFLLQKYFCEFVFVIMLDHLIVYVSTVWLEFFRDDECFTRATHQTRRKRLIKFDTSDVSSDLKNRISSNLMSRISSNLTDDISSNLTSDISSNLTNDISSNLTSDISSNLISDISSNLTRTLSVFSDKRSEMTRESICRVRLSLLHENVDRTSFEMKTDFVMSVLEWKLRRWHNLAFSMNVELCLSFCCSSS
jgi:uncharacterized protein (DUF2267 family)